MSKQAIHLTLVEMYAVKHTLQMQVRYKEKELRAMEERTIWEETWTDMKSSRRTYHMRKL